MITDKEILEIQEVMINLGCLHANSPIDKAFRKLYEEAVMNREIDGKKKRYDVIKGRTFQPFYDRDEAEKIAKEIGGYVRTIFY